MEILTFVLSVIALISVLVISLLVLSKNTKKMKLKFGLFKGFEFSCSFFDKSNSKTHK